MTFIAPRFLPVQGIVNARDLGGYTVRDGRHIREGRLLRASHLTDATDADLQYLARIPVMKVVDFRTEQELKGTGDRMIPGAEYVPLPVDSIGKQAIYASEKEKKKFTRRKRFEVKKLILMLAFNERAKIISREMYPTLFFDPDCQHQYACFFREVLNTENGAVLYHCTQGKDRTGIASALLMAALGADRDTIIADFDATNQVYAKDVLKYSRRVRFWGGKGEEVSVVKAILGANTENFVKAFGEINARYGSMEAYLKGPMKLTDQDISVLKERYLTV